MKRRKIKYSEYFLQGKDDFDLDVNLASSDY